MNEREVLIELLANDSILREIEDTEMYNTDYRVRFELRNHAHKTAEQLHTTTDIMNLVNERIKELVQELHLQHGEFITRDNKRYYIDSAGNEHPAHVSIHHDIAIW